MNNAPGSTSDNPRKVVTNTALIRRSDGGNREPPNWVFGRKEPQDKSLPTVWEDPDQSRTTEPAGAEASNTGSVSMPPHAENKKRKRYGQRSGTSLWALVLSVFALMLTCSMFIWTSSLSTLNLGKALGVAVPILIVACVLVGIVCYLFAQPTTSTTTTDGGEVDGNKKIAQKEGAIERMKKRIQEWRKTPLAYSFYFVFGVWFPILIAWMAQEILPSIWGFYDDNWTMTWITTLCSLPAIFLVLVPYKAIKFWGWLCFTFIGLGWSVAIYDYAPEIKLPSLLTAQLSQSHPKQAAASQTGEIASITVTNTGWSTPIYIERAYRQQLGSKTGHFKADITTPPEVTTSPGEALVTFSDGQTRTVTIRPRGEYTDYGDASIIQFRSFGPDFTATVSVFR